MVSNITLGRGAKLLWVWGWVAWDVTEEEGDWYSDTISIASGIVATSFILNPAWSMNLTGAGVRLVITNPVVQAVTAAVITGAIISNEIDEESGLDNYVGFITGGNRGTEDIHYYSGDANDSGYFNVLRNAEIVGQHYGPKLDKFIETKWEEAKRRFYQKPSWTL